MRCAARRWTRIIGWSGSGEPPRRPPNRNSHDRVRKVCTGSKAAKARSGIQSDSELLLYALSKAAVEDDFGHKLVARKGRIARDLELDI